MNLLIYFCIPLVVTGRTPRGTYGQEVGFIGLGELEENRDISNVAIVDAAESVNPETSETSESFSNFYPGHIDYSNPELKNYVADHQDGTYYRKGIEAHRAVDAISGAGPELAAVPGSGVGLGVRGLAGVGVVGDSSHPSFIPSNIYNSLKDKNKHVPAVATHLNGLHQETGHPPLTAHALQQDPGLAYGLPNGGLGLGLYGSGLGAGLGGGLDPRYAALLQPQKLVASPLASHSPAVLGYHHQQYPAGLLGGSPATGQLLYQPKSPVSPAYLHSSPSHYAPGPLAYSGGVVTDQEQLPVAQQVVPTIQAPLHLKAAYHPHQLLLKSAVPSVPLYHQPTLLKEVASPSSLHSPFLLQSPQINLPLLPQQQPLAIYRHPELLQGIVNVPPQLLLKTGPIPVPIQLKSVGPAVSPLPLAYSQPTALLQSQIGAVPLLKTAPGVEASIVPAIEEHVPEEVLGGPVVATHLLGKSPHIAPLIHPEALYLSPKAYPPKVLLKKPAVYTEKAVLKAALASPAYLDHHHHHHSHLHGSKSILKAPLVAHYVHQDPHVDPSVPSKILNSQKHLVHALISSDAPGKLYKKGIGKGAHLELVPSLSYGYSLSMYPDHNGVYGAPKLLDHDHPHSHIDDGHHHHHPEHLDDHHHHHHHPHHAHLEDDHHHHHHHSH